MSGARLLRFADAQPAGTSWSRLKDVLAIFRAKNILSSRDFDKLESEIKALSVRFVGVWNTNFVAALYGSIENAIALGLSERDWLPEAAKIIKAYGGAGALGITNVDATGSLSSWYADLVFRQNALNAMNAARYASMFFGPALEHSPFWLFATAEDERVCPICAPLDGLVFSKVDAAGRRFLPSLHFNCRCQAIELDQLAVNAGGYRITSGQSLNVPLSDDFNVDRLVSVPETLRRAA